jgi:hypothetical protein
MLISMNESKTAKISLAILALGGIVWLGGINIRALIGFDLLQSGTLDFKPNIHPFVERAVYGLIAQSSIIVNSAYILVWIGGIVFLRSTKLILKENGWLMMSAILFYMFTPVEIYTMVLDVKMWYLDFIGSVDLVEFRILFIHRLAALSGVPMIALLSYYSIIVVAVFRPFRRNTTPEISE